jgi:hypothetical protein
MGVFLSASGLPHPPAPQRLLSWPFHFMLTFSRWYRLGAQGPKLREYVSLSIGAPDFGAKTLYANLCWAAGQANPNVYPLIWSLQD